MAKVLMKSLGWAARYEHVVVNQGDLTISEVMTPENWPPSKAVGTSPMRLLTFVTIFAFDGAAQCYVAGHDHLGRPELAFFRGSIPSVPSIPNPRRLRSAEVVEQ